jgi:hypothetical protein
MTGGLCVGPEFGFDTTGSLRVDAIGDPVAWPFPCPIASGNGLNVDADGGAWTAPHGIWRYRDNQQATPGAGGIQLTGSVSYDAPLSTFTITNPSPVSPMLVCWWQMTWIAVDLSPHAAVLHFQVLGRGSRPADSALVQMATGFHPSGDGTTGLPAGTVWTWYDQRFAQNLQPFDVSGGEPGGAPFEWPVVAPSASLVFYPRLRVQSTSAAGVVSTLRQWGCRTFYQCQLIDPSQAGGVPAAS